MKKIIKYLTACTILFSNLCYADQYSANGTVTGLFSGAGNIVGVFHSATVYNLAGCTNTRAYLIDYSSSANWEKVFSMLMTAYASKMDIKIAVSPTICYSGYPTITRVAFGQGI